MPHARFKAMAFRPDSGYRIPRSDLRKLLDSARYGRNFPLIFTSGVCRLSAHFTRAITDLERAILMAAVDNKHQIEIMAVNVQSGVSRKTGLPFSIPKAQCIVRGHDGAIQIGELNLSKELAETLPGKYLAEFELGVSYERMIVPRITVLHPVSELAKPAAPVPKAT